MSINLKLATSGVAVLLLACSLNAQCSISVPLNQIFGSALSDPALVGTVGADEIFGLGGNDTISGIDGPDVIHGNEGDDLISGGPGNDCINGNQGHDTINGNQGDDFLQGGQGNDSVQGGMDNDFLLGNLGDDILLGNLGDDLFFYRGGDGHDQISDGAGTNRLWLSGTSFTQSSSVFYQRVNNDLIISQPAGVPIATIQNHYAGSPLHGLHFGPPVVPNPNLVPPVNLGFGHLGSVGLTVSGWAFDPNRFNSPPALSVSFKNLNGLTIDSGSPIYGLLRTDVGPSDAQVAPTDFTGFSYTPSANLPAGFYTIEVEIISTNGQRTHLQGSPSQPILYGSFDNDCLVGTGLADQIHGNGGLDTIRALGGNDTVNGNFGPDIIDGGIGNDRVNGGKDDDVILGGPGSDVMDGDLGDDVVIGGPGDDDLAGDLGSDIFIWSPGDGNDTIRDATAGQDILIIRAPMSAISPQDVGADLEVVVSSVGGTETITIEGAAGLSNSLVVSSLANPTVSLLKSPSKTTVSIENWMNFSTGFFRVDGVDLADGLLSLLVSGNPAVVLNPSSDSLTLIIDIFYDLTPHCISVGARNSLNDLSLVID